MHGTFRRVFGSDLPARHRPATALLLALILAAALALLPSLQFEDDIQRGFASDGPNSRALAALVATLDDRPRDVVVLAAGETPLEAADLEALRGVVLDIELLDAVAGVLSPFSLRWPSRDPAAPGVPVFGAEIDPDGPYGSLQTFEADYPGLPTLIAADRTALLFMATLTGGLDDAAVRRAVDEIARLGTAAERPGLDVAVTGEDAIAFAVVDALQTDLLVFSSIGNVFAFVLALIIFRGIRPALVAFLPAAAASLVSLAVYPLLGFPVTVFNVIVPILVLVLAVADAMHLTWHLQEQPAGRPLAERLAATLAAIGPANALTSITTACGFAAIGVAGFEQFDELAALGAVSVLAAYVIVVAGVVALAPLAGARRHAPAGWLRVPAAVARWPLERSGTVIVAAIVIAGLAGGAAARVEPWFPVWQNLPDGNPVRDAHRAVEDRFGGYLRLWFEIDATGDEAETFGRVRAVTDAVQDADPDMAVMSSAVLADWAGRPDRLPAEADGSLAPSLRLQFSTPDGDVRRVIALVPEPMHDRQTRDRHDRIVAAALTAGADRAIGFPMILRDDALKAIGELGRGLILAWLLATAVVAAVFASPVLFAVLTVPNVLPLAVTTAALHLLNAGQINMSAVLGLTVAFAIAIDDSIHFVNRYVLERAAGASRDAALATAMSQTGRVMIATTLLISVGLVATFASAFPTVRLFGAMMILTFAAALVADLLLLPALIRRGWWRR